MKKRSFKHLCCFLNLILFLAGLTASAQVDSLRMKLDNVFQNVNKSQIPTGFLDEYGAQFANLKTYNGMPADSNTINFMGWNYIYASIYSGNIYGSNSLPTPESNYTLFNNEAATAGSNIPVTMLAINYSSLRPDAVSSNLLSVSNGQLFDVANRQQSPYQVNTVFAAAPLFESSDNGKLSLIFKPSMFINTTGKSVNAINVNFDDGSGFVSASWNTIITASYLTPGIKRLTFKIIFTDGTSLQCYSNVTISNTYTPNTYQQSIITIPFNPVNNNHSGGDITVQYSVNNSSPTNNRKLQKPFIVVEGFDMHDAAPLLSKGYGYNNFWKEISTVKLNNISFNNYLDNIGSYDLIFLNYRDGTDDILRNVALLEQVINWVNTNKDATAQQNVIMGISMGGLVSRYCLAKMTKENQNPQTRLLITHDTPHRGSNIPLGMQFLINDLANKTILGKTLQDWIPYFKQAVVLQTRPATLQQLIVRDHPVTRNVEYNTFLAPNGPYRQMITFSSTDPQPGYKFIATAQGSECAVPVMQPYEQIAHTSGDVGYSILFGAFSTRFYGSTTVNALPNGGAPQRITYFDLHAKNRFLWFPFDVNLMHFEHMSPPGILAYDGAPAGTRGIASHGAAPFSTSNDEIISWLFSVSTSFDGLQVQPNFSFLPVVSALDEDNINATSLYNPHIGVNYVTPSNATLLQKYVAHEKEVIQSVPVFNREHTDFSSRESQWIYNQMENIPTSFCFEDFCNDTQINGPNELCNPSGDYSMNQIPPGSTVSWSVSPAGIVQQSCTNCTGVTLTQVSQGIVNLTATVTAPCGTQTFVMNHITVAQSQPPADIVGMDPSSYLGAGSTITLSVNEYAPSYDWQVAGGTIIGSSTGQTITVRLDGCFNGQREQNYFSATVRLQTDCGFSAPLTENAYASCGSDSPFSLIISPNPVKTGELNAKINISELLKKKLIKSTDRVTAYLCDVSNGRILTQWNLTNGQDVHKLSVTGIKKGQYVLKITIGDKSVSKQVSVE